jgi:hypothetical protein
MASSKSRKQNFNGMSYVETQRTNSNNRDKLKKEHQRWLKDNGYRNVGWNQVIQLYQKIEEFLDQAPFEEMSLEELFLEADRIGNKYLTPKEIQAFNQQLSEEVSEIADIVDQQFPDTEIEVIDFSSTTSRRSQRNRYHKTY